MEGDCGGRHSRVGSTYGGIIEGWGTGSQIPADRSRSLLCLLLQTPYVIASPGFGEACGLATSAVHIILSVARVSSHLQNLSLLDLKNAQAVGA